MVPASPIFKPNRQDSLIEDFHRDFQLVFHPEKPREKCEKRLCDWLPKTDSREADTADRRLSADKPIYL